MSRNIRQTSRDVRYILSNPMELTRLDIVHRMFESHTSDEFLA